MWEFSFDIAEAAKNGVYGFHRGFRCGRIKELGSLFLFKIRCEYTMPNFSTKDRMRKPKSDRRSTDIHSSSSPNNGGMCIYTPMVELDRFNPLWREFETNIAVGAYQPHENRTPHENFAGQDSNFPRLWRDVKVCSFDDAIYQTYVNLKADVNDRLPGVVLLARLLERLRVKEQRRLEEMAKATEAS
ncbi:hypothetical protein Tco_0896223 [Tanacetum coccineum]